MKKLVFIGILLAGLSSCWPSSVSFIDNGSMPAEWKSFSVKTLRNSAPNTPLSYAANLTEKIKDGIQNNTRLQLNPSAENAEVLIDGVISNYSISPVAIQQGDNSSKNRLTISVQFTIHISLPKKEELTLTSTRFVDYASSDDLATVEATLLEEINIQIVQDLINKLLSNW